MKSLLAVQFQNGQHFADDGAISSSTANSSDQLGTAEDALNRMDRLIQGTNDSQHSKGVKYPAAVSIFEFGGKFVHRTV